MLPLDAAYVAGIIDGEGSVSLNARKARGVNAAPVLSVASTDFELLEWLRATCGGTIIRKKTYAVAHTPSGEWKVTNRRALEVLREVAPHLKIERKRRRVAILLEDYLRLTPRNGRYTDEMLAEREAMVERFFAA